MEECSRLKQKTYEREREFFSPYAAFSENTKGRVREEEPCPMRTDYQRDRDRIIYSKAFRRLRNKTQVFFQPQGDHYITRLTHTLDVAQIARSIARALSLNEDLTEAIALGHDLGHTPFGHSGERILNRLNPNGFKHNVQSLRVVEVLEKRGQGLNLTYEVRDGILNHNNHTDRGIPSTLEGKCVGFADRIAYINHDIEDAVRAGILHAGDIPKDLTYILGGSSRERINTCVYSIYEYSEGKDFVAMPPEVDAALTSLRTFMFDSVYNTKQAQGEETKADKMLSELYNYFKNNEGDLPDTYKELLKTCTLDDVVSDYISSMTDNYAVYVFNSIFVPRGWTLSDEGNSWR
ncbi:MAG: deoxyguanosinetriphosphate triphosphohydrolase [Clostridia bacterium]|nr:deoxyguanosinetriphosphate triphosphohydrolase [Clostridia bacterium]